MALNSIATAPPKASLCPDCKRPMVPLDDDRPGGLWCCPIALEAHRRGILGQPGRKHKEAFIYRLIVSEPIGRVSEIDHGKNNTERQHS